MFDIQEELKKLPAKPGVYLMHNSKDEIIYVGKAIKLCNRVRQYFQDSRNLSVKIQHMVKNVAYFEYIITDSELEALVLENNLIKEHNLPPVVFHSLRHTSVTYKLKLNGGDIKAVQGDSGHSQINMVTDVYSHILDDDRRKNAELFEEAFYEKKNLDPQMHVQQENNNTTVADEVDPELLAKVLANPEMRALLNSLAKTMK